MTESQTFAYNSVVKPYRLLNMIIDSLFLGNGTILKLHIIPNRKLHTSNSQMTYNVAVCAVGTLQTTHSFEFCRSTTIFKICETKLLLSLIIIWLMNR